MLALVLVLLGIIYRLTIVIVYISCKFHNNSVFTCDCDWLQISQYQQKHSTRAVRPVCFRKVYPRCAVLSTPRVPAFFVPQFSFIK